MVLKPLGWTPEDLDDLDRYADPDPGGPEAEPPDWPDAWPGGEDWWAA